MSSYTYEVEVQTPRERVIDLLSDPFLLSGVFGHVSILQTFDQNRQEFVSPESLSSPTSRFKVIYVFGTPDTKVYTSLGEMVGPEFSVSGVSYKGFSFDNKVKWTLNFEVKSLKPSVTQVRILLSADYDTSFLDRLTGRKQFNLAEHIVKAHVVPYLRWYFKAESVSLDIKPVLKFSEEGVLGDLLPKVVRSIRDIEYGVVVIEGVEARGRMYVKGGKVVEGEVLVNGERLSGPEAVVQLLQVQSRAKVSVYTVDAWPAIISVLSRAGSRLSAEKPTQNAGEARKLGE